MRVEIADITTLAVDAIVNAANSQLLGGSGVDGAIHAAGGPAIGQACRELRATVLPDGLPVGAAVATTAGRLPATWVIHTVGPRAAAANAGPDDGQGDPGAVPGADPGARALAACHTNALRIADELGCRSVAFPAISCGVFGWRAEDAAPIAVRAVREFLDSNPRSVQDVVFAVISEPSAQAFRAAVGDS